MLSENAWSVPQTKRPPEGGFSDLARSQGAREERLFRDRLVGWLFYVVQKAECDINLHQFPFDPLTLDESVIGVLNRERGKRRRSVVRESLVEPGQLARKD